jgi:uncharacterized protein (DUF433 family)
MQKIEASEYRTIAEMRRDGASLQAIGERYGVTRERIRQIVVDNYPDITLKMAQDRKQESIRLRTCPECGGRKSISANKCHACLTAEKTKWTQERIIAAMQEYHRRYGKTPSCTEWNPALARWRKTSADAADRFYADGCWPHVQTVIRRFGSWTAAIEAAGLPPNKVGRRRK